LLDSRIRVTASAAACAAARLLWSGTLTDEAASVELEVDASLPLAPSLADIATRLNATVIENCQPLTVHAGVVASPNGAIALPAVSGAGKSTLVAACLLAGLEYVSDEALHLGHGVSGGHAVPYPRPLGLSEESAARLCLGALGYSAGDERLIAPEDLGLVARGPVPVRHVVALDRRTGATPSLERLTEADAVHLLLTHSFNHYVAPLAAMAAAARIASGACAWRLTYGEATEAAGVLSALLN
jgi:hypothetical protein